MRRVYHPSNLTAWRREISLPSLHAGRIALATILPRRGLQDAQQRTGWALPSKLHSMQNGTNVVYNAVILKAEREAPARPQEELGASPAGSARDAI
jgi:hypothetical protein